MSLLSTQHALSRKTEYWPLLKSAWASDRFQTVTLDWIEGALRAGQLRVWFDGKTLITAQVEGHVGYAIHGAGKLASILAILPLVEEWAFSKGAWEMRIFGRMGWKRLLKGYQVMCVLDKQVSLSKSLI